MEVLGQCLRQCFVERFEEYIGQCLRNALGNCSEVALGNASSKVSRNALGNVLGNVYGNGLMNDSSGTIQGKPLEWFESTFRNSSTSMNVTLMLGF